MNRKKKVLLATSVGLWIVAIGIITTGNIGLAALLAAIGNVPLMALDC